MHAIGLENGHPLKVLRTQLDVSQKDFAAKVGVSEATISRAENGHRLSPKVRRQLCDRLGMTSEALGLLGKKKDVIFPSSPLPPVQEQEHASVPQITSSLSIPIQSPSSPTTPVNQTQNVAFLANPSLNASLSIEQQEQAWLMLGASSLGQLFNSGWSIDNVLNAVKTVLQCVEGMPATTRQNLLGGDTLSGNRPFFTNTTFSEGELVLLSNAFGESIAASWKLFLSSNNAQLLALGQTQLALVQQAHPLLHPFIRPYLYAGVYSLVGMVLHFQERNVEALQAHQNAHIAASAIGNSWYIAASLISQADSHHALGQYIMAIQTLKEALYTIGEPIDEALVRLKSHLLSCWADNAMMLEDYKTAQEKLEASEEYLDQIMPNEEFDRAGWLLVAGKYALKTENYTTALRHFENALAELPEEWTLRRAMTALGLAKAYACSRERNKSLEVAGNLMPMIQKIDAKLINCWFAEYLQHDLLDTFPTDAHVRAFVSNTYQQIPQLITTK